jgi:hypothetical protein
MLTFGIMLGAASTAAAAKCGAAPGDAAAVAAARAQVDADCDCAGATNHGSYVSCAAHVARDRANAGLLPKQCKGEVTKCAAKSTCGKPGAVTCCRTQIKKGVPTTKCSIQKSAAACTSKGGCVGAFASCCDACTNEGCAGSTTTTTAAPTTTTTEAPTTTTTVAPTTTTTLGSPSGAFLSL